MNNLLVLFFCKGWRRVLNSGIRVKSVFCATLITCLAAFTAIAQTSKQIKEKYGRPTEAYSVSEHIWMTPKFTPGGQVCSMRLYAKRISPTTNYLSDKLDYWELKKVLDQLAPPEKRGKTLPFFGMNIFGFGNVQTNFGYEKVRFSFITSIAPYFEFKEKEEIKTDPAKSGGETSHSTKPKKEMIVPYEAEIVIISWYKKACAE